jgi:hypothetical protein
MRPALIVVAVVLVFGCVAAVLSMCAYRAEPEAIAPPAQEAKAYNPCYDEEPYSGKWVAAKCGSVQGGCFLLKPGANPTKRQSYYFARPQTGQFCLGADALPKKEQQAPAGLHSIPGAVSPAVSSGNGRGGGVPPIGAHGGRRSDP